MEELIAFLKTTAGVVTSITVIVGGAISLVVWMKKGFRLLFKELLEPVVNDIKKVSDDIVLIKKTSADQMEKINLLLETREQFSVTDKHILRALITGKYYEYTAKGYLPIYERECLSMLFEDYKTLLGNSFIDDVYEKLMKLPCDPEIPCE